MHGNVYEWVEDPWHGNYQGAPIDGAPWMKNGHQSQRVVRGGSWTNDAPRLRTADRFMFGSAERYNNTGFRLARTLDF